MGKIARTAWRPLVMGALAILFFLAGGPDRALNYEVYPGEGLTSPDSSPDQLISPQSPDKRESILRLVNLSADRSATVFLRYFEPGGNLAAPETTIKLAAGTAPKNAAFVFVDRNDQLPTPFYGSALLESDRPVGALHIRHSVESGRDIFAATVGPDSSFPRLLIPMLFSNFPLRDLPSPVSSRINIFNPSQSQTACVWISFWDLANQVRLSDGVRPLADPVQCPKGGHPIVPGGSLARDLEEMASSLGAPYIGSAFVYSVANKNGQVVSISGDVEIWNGQQYGAYTGPGLVAHTRATDGVHKQVVLPLVYKENGPFNSYLHIQSSNWVADIKVRLTFRDIKGGVFSTIALVGRNRSLDLRWIPDFRLPSGFRGSVTIENITNNNVITATVLNHYRSTFNHPFFVYEAAPTDAATSKVIMPLVYKNREGTTSSNGWNSRIAIQTNNGAADSLSLSLAPEVCCAVRSARVKTSSNGFLLVNVRGLATSPSLFNSFVGSGEISSASGRTFVAIVINENNAFFGDLWAAYTAIGQ